LSAIRPHEQLLIDLVPQLPAASLLANTAGRGQFARAWAEANPQSTAVCHFFDLYQQQQAAEEIAAESSAVRCVVAADLPTEPVELVAFAVSKGGEAELVRDGLQQGHDRLVTGGRLVAASDNPRDHWLHDELRKLFPKVTRRPLPTGVVYLATKHEPLRKMKNFACEFAVHDRGRELLLRTRPGVFSHRELDGGARALIEVMDVEQATAILDVGCGCGVVGLVAAARNPQAKVLALDSHARAIEATAWGATSNQLSNVEAVLCADGGAAETATYDVALANPPYYSNQRIAEIFVRTAARGLKPGGVLWLVTKRHEWYAEYLPSLFATVEMEQVRSYVIVKACR
jgi:16S rRNA (guanine1207-N2)-methyltransferase